MLPITTDSLLAPPPVQETQTHPLLQALARAQHGYLHFITPGGTPLYFGGALPGPSAHMHVHDWSALDEGIAHGETGFAESYIDGRWDSENLPALLTYALLNADVLEQFFHGKPLYALWMRVRALWQGNSLRGSKRNIMSHYNLGNDFYALWLDEGMTYSCALFEGNRARTLEEAQAAKYQRILRKLNAKPGAHILEIGCGWGGFAEAAATAGYRVTGITLSAPQAEYASKRLWRKGLDRRAQIELCDYRKLSGQFDHVVSIGMFEHVGEKYWPAYFNAIRRHLRPGGRAMIQTITLDDDIFEREHGHYGFIDTYIFPGGMLPSKRRFRQAAEKAGLACKEMFAFGQDYAQTTRCWLGRFETNLDAVKRLGYDERFIRLWRFYLSSCIASFVSRRSDVMQVELTRG